MKLVFIRSDKRLNSKGHIHFILPLLCIALVAIIGAKLYLHKSHAQTPPGTSNSCEVTSNLMNSCHPWFGAAVGGDPKAPGGAKSSKTTQFDYLESLIGRHMDLYHDYHSPGTNPLNTDEIHFANRANTYDYVNWKPASTWAAAGGSNAAVNASIKQAADNIKAIAPRKIFLTVWHEPENDISGFDNDSEQSVCHNSPSFKALKGTAGTPAQYRAMWQNVHNIFNAQGVTNVVWVMNYMGYKNWDCLIQPMWPGNNLVDWVTMDAYGAGSSPTWDSSVGRIYNVLQADSNATDDFNSKPWGSAEFNTCGGTDTAITNYFVSARQALDANTYPRLRMYMVFDSANGPGGTAPCLVDRDSAALSAFKNFANDPKFTATTSPGGGSNSLQISIKSPSNGATISNTASVVGATNSDSIYASLRIDDHYVTGVHFPSNRFNLSFDTSKLSNGKHSLLLRVWDNHHHYLDTKAITINVRN